MNQHALLKKTIALAKTGDKEAFENFYILTVQDTYAKISFAVKDDRDAAELLVDTYAMLYRHVRDLPSGDQDLTDWIDDKIRRIAYQKWGLNIHDLYYCDEYAGLSENKAATQWMRIEEKAGLNKERVRENKESAASSLVNIGRILITILIFAVTVFVLYKGWGWIRGGKESGGRNAAQTEAVEETSQSRAGEISIEKDLKEPGWEKYPDGSLHYVKNDGTSADSVLAIGKQMLTFSPEGELTLLGSNRAVSEDPDLSFDELVRYEVREGDIYRKDPSSGEAETCIVMNGHVVQADVRNGFLWYICKYQVPNSQQVKTTIYRAHRSGEKQEEIYSTESTLNTEQFQISADWMYYISEGMLLRRNMGGGSVELLAENVEYYYAWEDTAYYMNERTLESVSQGIDYSGIEAGYKIELQDKGLVLLDMLGEVVKPDANGDKQVGDRIYTIIDGSIAGVSPAAREDNGVTYYIDSAGYDRKIYSKSSSGAQGLIRQEGLTVDSLCIAGEWLYYSARIGAYGGEPGSRIYRLNLQNMELEEVGDSFGGFIKNLYYFDDLQQIFGEYIPSLSDPENIHGKIAVMSIGEEMRVIEKTDAVPSSEGGSDMLELVMADGSRIYCLYHTCTYDVETAQMTWTSTQPVEIQFNTTGS